MYDCIHLVKDNEISEYCTVETKKSITDIEKDWPSEKFKILESLFEINEEKLIYTKMNKRIK